MLVSGRVLSTMDIPIVGQFSRKAPWLESQPASILLSPLGKFEFSPFFFFGVGVSHHP